MNQCYGCGPGMCGPTLRVWTKADQLKQLDKYEENLKEELKAIEEARTSLNEEK